MNMLLDCGEGTFSQLLDREGLDNIDKYLEQLRVIFISHIHVDHNLGMFKILAERIESQKKMQKEFKVK